MPRYDFSAQRLFVDAPLDRGALIAANPQQSHYLATVLRMADGAVIVLFNGRDGEWKAELAKASRKGCTLRVLDQLRPQPRPRPLVYAFAPLKSARLDYLIQKAVEMGATRLAPVLTRRTQLHRLNHDRLRANIVEAAEQCGILTLPELAQEQSLERFLAERDADGGPLIFCDEDEPVSDPLPRLLAVRTAGGTPCLLIGPEGGFDPAERAALQASPGVVRLSLGPRILRADTAAVAALALVQVTLGDWR